MLYTIEESRNRWIRYYYKRYFPEQGNVLESPIHIYTQRQRMVRRLDAHNLLGRCEIEQVDLVEGVGKHCNREIR